MGLVNTIDLMKNAEEHSYALGSFNITNLEFLNGILEAAEQERSPVIISIAEVHFPYVSIEQITPVIKYMSNNSCVPVVLNLDHGLSIETVVRALRCGFSAVMYDASRKPLEQNIEETKLVVNMAHSVGVSVEAELGCVGGAEGSETRAVARREFFTDPAEAERFVAETGIDCLAIAVGNAHGLYKGEPELDFQLIEEIKRRLGVPLVLHGGSGIPDGDFRRAIQLGIRKINFFTEMSMEAANQVRETIKDPKIYQLQDIMKSVKEAIIEVVRDRLRVFGSSGACTLPGNICPTHGVCAERSTCAIEEPKNVKAPASESESEQIERTISSISSKLSQEDIVNIVTEIVQKVRKAHT